MALLAMIGFAGCGGGSLSPPANAGGPLDSQLAAKAGDRLRDLLAQAADRAVNQLGQPDGYWKHPQARIALPEAIRRLDRQLRRFGLDHYADELALNMNRAAEQAVPLIKVALRAAIREMDVKDAVEILRGGDGAATRVLREKSDAALARSFRPLIADATARTGALASYKRLMKKLERIDRDGDHLPPNLDDYLTREALDGLWGVMGDEERRLRGKLRIF